MANSKKKVVPPHKPRREQDEMMRMDGYVTPQEVAEATGMNLASVHRALADQRFPGIGMEISETRTKWYVDIYGLMKLDRFTAAQAPTIHENLRKLSMLVNHPAKAQKRVGT